MKAELLVISTLLLALPGCRPQSPAPAGTPAQNVPTPHSGPSITLSDGFDVHVEIASDDDTRTQGLMYRDRLAADVGMIFIFPQSSEYAFWMKNTLIPLDMVWLDEAHKVVHVAHDVPPCKADPCPSYPPNAIAKYVLELQGGSAARHHVKDGDTLRFNGLDKVIVR